MISTVDPPIQAPLYMEGPAAAGGAPVMQVSQQLRVPQTEASGIPEASQEHDAGSLQEGKCTHVG